MGISGISDYSSLFASYKVPEIPSVDFDQIKKADELANVKSQTEPLVSQNIDLSIDEKQLERPESININELSLTFNAGDDFGYIGKDSDIEDLDMQKAISDMKKDQVLQQYQYFVGNSETLFPQNSSEDGHVFLKFE
ncbi:MAG TPA: hypothetical protein VJY54_09630 [Lachnospiraceae bacterium]|nr:hypothetical protein [Lachnospiraceae bacterium]